VGISRGVSEGTSEGVSRGDSNASCDGYNILSMVMDNFVGPSTNMNKAVDFLGGTEAVNSRSFSSLTET
jgi:hypothetical protein